MNEFAVPMRNALCSLSLLLCSTAFGGSRPRDYNAGWVYVRLEGSPNQIGYKYGFQLAPEIDDAIRMEQMYLKQTTKQSWAFYREASQRLFWKKLDPEYKAEISSIAAGMRTRGYKYDANDLLAHNSWIELAWYYEPLWEANHKKMALVSKAPDSCSAFIATGTQTKDGKIVMAHNAWIDYVIGERWNAILDIRPTHGHRILMDAIPGFIHSGDDFAINSKGIMVTETTIAGAAGFDVNGTPEFERMRRAIQYSDNLDDFARIMTKGNNGGYANTWLVGDTKTNEIGELQLALKNVVFRRSTEGAYVSANFPQDPKLIAEDCLLDVNKGSTMCSDRHVRWNAVMTQFKGKIDTKAAMSFLGDHHHEADGTERPERLYPVRSLGDRHPEGLYHSVSGLHSRRFGPGQSDDQRSREPHELLGEARSPVRRGISRDAVPRPAPRIQLGASVPPRHEVTSLDKVFIEVTEAIANVGKSLKRPRIGCPTS